MEMMVHMEMMMPIEMMIRMKILLFEELSLRISDYQMLSKCLCAQSAKYYLI